MATTWKCYYAAKDGKYECKEIDDENNRPEAYLYKFRKGKLEKFKGHLCRGNARYCVFYSFDELGNYKRHQVSNRECHMHNNLVWLSVPADGVAIDIFLHNKNIDKKCILEYLEKCEKDISVLNELKKGLEDEL